MIIDIIILDNFNVWLNLKNHIYFYPIFSNIIIIETFFKHMILLVFTNYVIWTGIIYSYKQYS